MTDRPKAPSLRDIAKRLGCSHSSLSDHIRRGHLTRGVGIRNGRAVVTDAEALIAQWNGSPVRNTLETIVLRDVAMDCEVTAAQLFDERDALSLLACALTRDALAGRKASTLKARISPRLREVAELHGAGDAEIARAWEELQRVIDLLADADSDSDSEADIES